MQTLLKCLALLVLGASAHATIIQPNTATASSNAGSSYVPTNTINGSGLLGPVSTLPNHGPYTSSSGGNHWTSDGSAPLNEWIQWGFTTAQTLDTIYVWNHQSTTSLAINANYDVTAFTLTFFDSSNTQIGTYSNTLAVDSAAAQAFNFGVLSGISSVRFDINGTQGSTNYTGLAEVAFNTASPTSGTVPDTGASVGLLSTSLLGLFAFSRRRLVRV
jgi:hypothetical protein